MVKNTLEKCISHIRMHYTFLLLTTQQVTFGKDTDLSTCRVYIQLFFPFLP